MSHITPTVGRKVWYRPTAYDKSGPGGIQCWGTPPQPVDATVIAVNSDRNVNLFIVDHAGRTHVRTSVRLLQDNDDPARDTDGNDTGGYAEWMPYQLGQAKREEATPAQPVGTVTYADGTTATGTLPLPATSPGGAPAVEAAVNQSQDLVAQA